MANQLQLSITHASIVAQGVAANMPAEDQSIGRDNGIVDYCRLHDITIQAWSPFQAGFFTGVFLDYPDYPELNAVIDRLAGEVRRAADRDRDRLDHPAPRADAGRPRHDEPRPRARVRHRAPTSR